MAIDTENSTFPTGDRLHLGRFDNSKLFSAYHVGLQLLLVSLAASIVAAEVLAGGLFVLWVVLMARGVRYRRTALDIPVLIFILVRLLSIVFSEYPSMSYVTITRELVYYAGYFFTVYYLQNVRPQKIESLLKVLIISTGAITAIAITQFLLGHTLRVNALTGGGMLSTQLAFVMLVALVAKDVKSIFRSPMVFWLLMSVCAIGLALSMTRGDWIATAAGVVLFSAVFNRKLLFGMIAFSLVLLLVVPSVRHRMTTLENPLQNTSDRITLWKNAVSIIGVHPVLGFGPETFHAVFTDVEHLGDKQIGAWHNDVLQLYMESGGIGVLSFGLYMGCLLFLSLRLIMHSRYRPDELNIGWMGLLLLVAYLISGMFTMPTISITNGILFRFLIAIVAVEYQHVFRQPGKA
ncbi:MAG: O-antigen ligase family protein [Bacteroidota bacterium]|jgi:O-antigen ligase